MPVPENAQLSEDGLWWWDEEISDWRQVEAGEAEAAGEPAFDFDWNGVVFNEIDMGVAQAGEELKVAFAVVNTGTAPGSAHVVIYLDDQPIVEWDSPWTQPGDSAAPDGDGYIGGIPPQEPGDHKVEGVATPPGPGNGGRTGATNINL